VDEESTNGPQARRSVSDASEAASCPSARLSVLPLSQAQRGWEGLRSDRGRRCVELRQCAAHLEG